MTAIQSYEWYSSFPHQSTWIAYVVIYLCAMPGCNVKKHGKMVNAWGPFPIADVAVMKRHQRRDEIRILPAHHSKVVFKKIAMQCICPWHLRNPVRTAHACALAINTRVSYSIRLLEMRTFLAEKQLCWFQYGAGKNYKDFILPLIAFPYSNICYCNSSTKQ